MAGLECDDAVSGWFEVEVESGTTDDSDSRTVARTVGIL